MASPILARLAWTLIHSVWQGALVALLLLIALGFAYRAAARVRYGLGLTALAALVALPVATFMLLGEPATPTLTGGATETLLAPIVVGASAPASGMPWIGPLVGAWLLGVALFSLRLLGSMLQIERWRRHDARPAEAELSERVRALAGRLGISRAVTVLVTERASVPGAWGLFRPALMVPISLVTGLPPTEVEAILLHELAHIRRHDFAINVLQGIVETVLFYHPATWWISSLVRREREYCCDDLVVAALGDPLPYARALLSLEERRHALPYPALSARGGHLMNRIQRLLARPAAPSRLFPTASAVATLGLVAAVLGAAIQAQATPQARPVPRPVAKAAVAPKPTAKVASSRAAAQVQAKQAVALAEQARKVAARRAVFDRYWAIKTAEAQVRTAVAQAQIKAAPAGTKRAEVPTKAATRPAAPVKATDAPVGGASAIASAAAPAAAQGGVSPATVSHAFVEEEPTVVMSSDGRVTLDAKLVMFPEIARRLAKATGNSIVIEAGTYTYLNVVLSGQNFENTLRIICRAGGATWRMEEGIYYISPKPKETSGGFGGGGGFGG